MVHTASKQRSDGVVKRVDGSEKFRPSAAGARLSLLKVLGRRQPAYQSLAVY